MKLDLRPLLAGDRLLRFDYELTLDTDSIDAGSFLFGVGFPSPMKVSGEITNTAGYMRMTLTMSVDYTAECARCLNKAGHMIQIKTPDLGGINNTIEAVLYCKEKGVGAYQGGTCNETDRSAQVCVHCAMATQPVQILAKPGMGVDEGYMIVYNEMNRIMALYAAKKAK